MEAYTCLKIICASEVYGTIDDLNAWIGILRERDIQEEQKIALIEIQNHLFTLCSEFVTPVGKLVMSNGQSLLPMMIDEEIVDFLEIVIDQMQETLPPFKHFIFLGGHPIVLYVQMNRQFTVAANVFPWHWKIRLNPLIPIFLKHLNRFSEYLFVLAHQLGFDHKIISSKNGTPICRA